MKYVAIDIGNVLYHCDFNPFLEDLSQALNITLEEAQYFLGRTQKLHDLGCTVMSDELRDHFKIRSPIVINKLIDSWCNSVKPNLDILNTLNRLSQYKKLQVALLSNIGLEHAALIDQTFATENILHKCIKHFSCFVGARKPSLLFYQSFLTEYPDFKGCTYVDDIKENLEMGYKMGFKTIQFSLIDSPADDLISTLEEIAMGK